MSKHKQLEHHNTGAGMVNDLFMAHAQMEQERADLMSCAMRSTTGGARRGASLAEAAKGHRLSDAHRSKQQRRSSVILGIAEAAHYKEADLWKRGKGSVAQQRKRDRTEADEAAAAVDSRRVTALTRTHVRGQTGKLRKASQVSIPPPPPHLPSSR